MKNSEDLIRIFYNSFAKRDFQTMQKCYHDEAHFSDPIFTYLEGKKILAMWHMLCEAGTDLIIESSGIGAYDNTAKATWKAIYTFSRTSRMIHNEVTASFVLRDNLIISHHDSFSMWNWAKMAFGIKGLLLGWTDFFKNKVRNDAGWQLTKFIDTHPEYKAYL